MSRFTPKETYRKISDISLDYLKNDVGIKGLIFDLEKNVQDILSIGNQTGEGWFLTAEMVEYIEHGITNIVCVQPFACLPNHVVGKGVIKTIRSKYPDANISPIDYDPGASEANQTNRLKLLMTVAKDNLNKTQNLKISLNSTVEDNKEEILIK